MRHANHVLWAQESELTPTGSNLLDGRFAVFGYVVDNATLLADLQVTTTLLARVSSRR